MSTSDQTRRFECSDVDRFADAYLDGEFDAPERSLFEAHVQGCKACRGGLESITALKSLLRARVGTGPAAPEGLRDRIRSRLVEAERQERNRFVPAGAWSLQGLQGLEWRRWFWPLLAGAAGAGALSLVYTVAVPQRAERWVVGDAAEMHARALPLEIATPQLDKLMPLFQHHLGFQVNPPAFAGSHVALAGGRLWHLGARDAAYLRYDDPSHGGRMSLFIVDDPGLTWRMSGAARMIPGTQREVWVSQAHGSNVVVWRSRDVVYSLVSDLGEDETLSLLRASASY
jgi:anti-sigma factor (TIGR02949 family)